METFLLKNSNNVTKASEDPIEKKRLYSLWCVSLGETVPDLAKRLGIREATIRKTIHSYNADGLERIQDQRKLRCGRKPYLDQAATEEANSPFKPASDGSFWQAQKSINGLNRSSVIQFPKDVVGHISNTLDLSQNDRYTENKRHRQKERSQRAREDEYQKVEEACTHHKGKAIQVI